MVAQEFLSRDLMTLPLKPWTAERRGVWDIPHGAKNHQCLMRTWGLGFVLLVVAVLCGYGMTANLPYPQ